MKRTVVIVLVLLAVLVLTVSASGFQPQVECVPFNGSYITLCRMTDPETGALCYTLDAGYSDRSISCVLPVKFPPTADNNWVQ